MKKTVLFLMNGFGIEQVDSYSIYNAKLMPNLDKYTTTELFSTIESSAFDQTDGYRLFSTGSNYSLTYTLIDQCMEKYQENQNMNYYLDTIKEDTKIQLFLFIENEKSLEHIKAFLKFIRTKKQNPIYLHLVLTSTDINNYKEVEKVANKIMYDYKDLKIASIVGENTLKATNLVTYMNLLQNEVGEKWVDVTRKFITLTSNKVAPANAKEFHINSGFKIAPNDSFFFFNYNYTDFSNLLNNITKAINSSNYFSLFQMEGIKYPMYAYPSSGISMANSLNKIAAKALIMTNKQNMKVINYYCNGLKNNISDRLFFTELKIEDLEYIKAVIERSEYDLIIIDYRIDDVKNVMELNGRLSKLDSILGNIHDFCVEKEITLFISSLYGMKKELPIDNFMKAFVNFASKVPFIVVDPVFKKSNFHLGMGNVYNLAHTIYTNINNKYDGGEVLIKRNSQIAKMLKK